MHYQLLLIDSQYINIIIYLLIIFLLLIFYIVLKKYIKNKRILKAGIIGEQNVQNVLKKLNQKKYYIFNDIILSHPNKRTSQIDHLIISRKGIFVIETKNYSGVLYGDVKEKYWIHISGKNRHTVYNIIFQNQGHIKCVKNKIKDILLKELDEKQYEKFFVSLLLFNENCKVKIKRPLFYKKNFKICKISSLIKNIKKRHRFNIISKRRYIELISEIEKNNISSKQNLKKHIYQIKKIDN